MMLLRLGCALAPLTRALRLLRRPALTCEAGKLLATETGLVLIEE